MLYLRYMYKKVILLRFWWMRPQINYFHWFCYMHVCYIWTDFRLFITHTMEKLEHSYSILNLLPCFCTWDDCVDPSCVQNGITTSLDSNLGRRAFQIVGTITLETKIWSDHSYKTSFFINQFGFCWMRKWIFIYFLILTFWRYYQH